MQSLSGYNFTKIKQNVVSQYLLHEEWIMPLQTMLKMSTGSANTSMHSQAPLSNGQSDYAMKKSCPFSHVAPFQVDHIVNLGAVDTFL